MEKIWLKSSAGRRSAMSDARIEIRSCIAGSKKRNVLRPAAFAMLNARSARFKSSMTVSLLFSNCAAPMLAVLM